MIDTYLTLPLMLQIYWAMAIIASVIFVIQAIMTFAGFDADSDMDVDDPSQALPESGGSDFDADGFHLVSVKSIISFILGFGWTGALCWDYISSPVLLGFVSFLVGLLFMATIAFLLYQVLKLNKDNTFRVEQTIGKPAEVYLRIPAGRQETGKITISVNGSMHELEALSDEMLPTGTKVRILEVVEGDTVLVKAY